MKQQDYRLTPLLLAWLKPSRSCGLNICFSLSQSGLPGFQTISTDRKLLETNGWLVNWPVRRCAAFGDVNKLGLCFKSAMAAFKTVKTKVIGVKTSWKQSINFLLLLNVLLSGMTALMAVFTSTELMLAQGALEAFNIVLQPMLAFYVINCGALSDWLLLLSTEK